LVPETKPPMQPVSCNRCGVGVLVRKNSLAHTLVQWTTRTDQCSDLSDRTEPGESRALTATCHDLRDSIEKAVRNREIDVADL
jgi:hypothetical protein